MKNIIYILLIILSINDITGQTITLPPIKAFPTAHGFGRETTGGRGGSVLFVTNLNNSGSGSLRAALEASGARIVVFRVGGTITLNSAIYITNPNLTIAGETAPGDGILIKGNLVQVETSNVIIRNIRFRVGTPTSGSDVDAFSITAWSGQNHENIILDHCSFSWGEDENFNIRCVGGGTNKNITLQNSIVSECGYGVLVSYASQNVSFYQNLLALNDQRNIRAGYGQEGQFKFEMVNNLIYGWNYAATNPANGQKYTILNNKYKASDEIAVIGDGGTCIKASVAETGAEDSWTYAFIKGNIIPSDRTLYNSRISPYIKTTPFNTSDITIDPYPASMIEEEVLNHVGASLTVRDAVDSRIVNNYNAATGVYSNSGTFPTISSGTPYTDSDNDGMADDWEVLHGVTSRSDVISSYTIDGRTIDNSEGWSAMDIFLADMAGDFDRIPLSDDGSEPDPTPPVKGKGINRNIFLTLE